MNYPFFNSNKFIDFSESIWISSIFFYVFQNIGFEKKLDYNRATVSWISRKILGCNMEYWYRNISEIRNVTVIFQSFQTTFQKRKKNWKIQMDSKQSINSFLSHLIIYGTSVFGNWLITYRHYYYAKYIFRTSLIWLILFRFLSYREVLKFWSY